MVRGSVRCGRFAFEALAVADAPVRARFLFRGRVRLGLRASQGREILFILCPSLPEEVKGPIVEVQMLGPVNQQRPARILDVLSLAQVKVVQASHKVNDLGWGNVNLKGA